MKQHNNISSIKERSIQTALLTLLFLIVGVGSAWGQDPEPTKSVWDGNVPSTADVSKAECNKIGITGSGTEAEPYVISTAGQFAYFASKMDGNTAWWELVENIEINLNGENHPWKYGQSNANFKGHFDGNGSTISNMKFETNGANKSLGLFPQIQGSNATNHAEIKNLTLKNCQITTPGSATSYGGTTNVGLLVGKINGNADIEKVAITGGSIAYEVTTTGANYVGALAGNVTSDNCTIKQCAVSGTSVTTGNGVKKDFYLGGLAGNVSNNSILAGNTVSNISITLDGNTSGNNIIGGLIGKVAGTNSTASATLPMGKRTWVQKNIVKKSAISMNGSVETANLEIGGLIGWVGNNVNVFNNKVDSTAIELNNTINNSSYVGGAIGYFDKQSFVDGMIVSGTGSITGPSADKTVKNAVVFFVGGFLGYQNSSAATNFDANKFKNVAVMGMNINLGHYVPAGQIKDHKFSVGGIVGSVNAPNMKADGTWGGMPENLIFKGGKIYAPWASTSPIVGNFNAAAATHQNMTLDQVTTVDAIEMAKAKTWYYNDYKLGLSSEFLNSASVIEENAQPEYLKFRKNYSKATETIDGIKYLAIDNSTLTRYNRYQDSERDLKTVLWWTQQASKDNSKTPPTVAAVTCFTANEQPIYPQSGATAAQAGNLADYPYYMYFFQGVGNAKYASKTDAENIVKGIEANFTNDVMPAVAMSSETNLNVVITNEGETRRGFDERTLTVTVNEGSTDATSNYTYQWYLNGKAYKTGTSIKLTPHWKDGTGITVNALNGSTIVATATYTLAPGVLHTKKSIADASAETVRSDINGRGTSANPYIIDCESALRQWSYLSTANTTTRWEDLAMPFDPMTNKASTLVYCHYNRAYYELGADITMGTDPFIPISHVGYGSDGTWGTYSNNFSFQGNFDGKGHKISGLKITWGAGQYNGNKTNIYHGLFGLVGHSAATAKWGDGSTTSNTVIQNLVIENATLTHDPNNTTFSYKKNYSHITADNYNNCMVGVLAGVVAANTTVQNIEIRSSQITDDGSNDYSLATMGLFVGGAIGSVQGAYNNENIPTNTIIKNIVVGTDINLTHAKIQAVAIAQQGAYNVGGIIGRFASTNGNLAATQAVMPKYTLYTGTINAYDNSSNGKKDALISPVIAATRYSSNQSISVTNISKIWEGNDNKTEQLTVTDALYYNFKIGVKVEGAYQPMLITEDYPANLCPNGVRPIDVHTDGNESAAGYTGWRYQGVNYAARFLDAATYEGDPDGGKRMAIAILNSHDDVTMYWEWTPGDQTPHMTTVRTVGAYIEADATTTDQYNVVGTATDGDRYYKWFVDGVEQSEHSASIVLPADIKEQIVKAEVYETSGAASSIAITQYIVIKGGFDIVTSITKTDDTYSVGIVRETTDLIANPDSRLQITYQWYKGDVVNTNIAEKLSGKTEHNITITKGELGKVNNLFCHIVISSVETGNILYEGNVSYFVGDAIVVFLQLNDVTASNGTYYPKTNAGSNSGTNDSYGVKQVDYATASKGKTPDAPVNSWAEAYALLNPYTEPTQADVTAHGGTWTSATVYDDEAYYLANKDSYPFDIYKRDDNKRKVKPIDKCESNWEKNIIVLMGLSNDDYFNNSTNMPHNVDGVRANKPVTITGMFNGVNYYGFHSNPAGDLSINADTKFENMGLGVSDKDATGTASVRYRIYAHRWNVYAGRGLLMGWAAAMKWGESVVPVTSANKKLYKITNADVSTGTPKGNYACDIAIMGGYLNDNTSTNPEMFEYINHGRDDIGQQITIESGFWGPVCPGNRQTDSGSKINTYYTMGGPDHPAKTTITVDIYREDNDGNETFNSAMAPATVDVGCLLTGNHEGTMYADVTLNILSAKMGRIVNGIKGAQRRKMENPQSFTTAGHYRHIINYGTKETPNWIEVAAPAPDSFFGRGIMNFDPASSQNNAEADVDGRVSVIELYCGGLGRGHNDGSYHPEVRTYFYGLSEINIKGGTFKETIFGCGAGGTNGIGTAAHHTDDDGIPYWNTDYDSGKNNVWYAPYEYVKTLHNYDFVKVKVADNNKQDSRLTADGYVDLEKTSNVINITGGALGTMANPVSIYAGGNGEADATLINPSKTTVGDVKNTYNTPNHQAGTMFGSGVGYVSEVNIGGNAIIYGSIYGGGRGSNRYYRYFLRAANDIIAYTADNQEYSRIWNPKMSSNGDYNTNGGLDWQRTIDLRRNADNYLNLGQVYGNTRINITGNAEIYGNVFGAGEGVPDVTVDALFSEIDSELGLDNQLGNKDVILDYSGTALDADGNPTGKRTAIIDKDSEWVGFPNLGKLFGNSMIVVNSENAHIHGNIYGGGKAGAMDGNSTVVIKAGIIDGDVFGAGQGEAGRPDKAKVTGNTNVIVDSGWTEPTPEP